jgi:hypothetical protein
MSYAKESDVAVAPRAMLTESAPPNVSRRSLATSIVCPPAPRDRAMWADVMVSGLFPNAFEKRTRATDPPMDV